MKRFARILAIGAVIFSPLLAWSTAYAASATMYLSLSASGSDLIVSVRENSGSEPVNAVKADLTYSTSSLTYSSIRSSSAFSIVAQNSGGNGSVHVDRGALPAVSGDQLVASVVFRSKVSNGTVTVNIANSSSVISASSNTNILASTKGGSYTFKTTVAKAAPVDKTPPTIKDVKAGDIEAKSAVVSWTTSEPANSEVDYGINTGYGLTAVDNNYVTAHKVVLNSALLSPGVTYHFRVKSTDPSGNTSSSPDATFTTKGASLQVTVVDQNNKRVSGAKVTFGSHSGTTDKQGQVIIDGLTLGKQAGTVSYRGKSTPVTVQVSDSTGKPQAVSFKIQTTSAYAVWIIAAAVLVLLLGVAALIVRKGRGGTPGPSEGGGNPFSGIKKLFSHRKQNTSGGPGGTINPTVAPPSASSTDSTSTNDPNIIRPS